MVTPAERRRTARRFRIFRLVVLLVFLAIVSLLEPDFFRFVVRHAIRFEAWRHGVSAEINGLEGSLFEPLKLRNSVWSYESSGGPITRIEIQTATAEFSWRNLWRSITSHDAVKWFQRLSLEGVSGKILLPLESLEDTPEPVRFRLPQWSGTLIAAPERVEAKDVDFIFQSSADYVRISKTEFTLSDVEAGEIRAGQIEVHQSWLNRTFREVRGATKMEGSMIDIANLTLEPGVEVRDISVHLANLAKGFLNVEMDLAAFDGSTHIEAQTLSQGRAFAIDATSTFLQISVAKLATFLGLSDAAGGAIKEGKFTFRGPPQRLAEATAMLRFEATNFQWDSRQWDSLVAGATLMDGRIQIPGISLTQGHNQLNLNGEIALPSPNVEWWQSEFNLNFSAKIDNLTEISALLLPEFKYAAGKANIDGSIRGKNQQFHGQIIASGSDIQWHSAPIEELHASVRLNGNEFQVTNVSLFNEGDFLRGRGVVNILGDKQYWGEIRASIQDLAKYASILQKPLAPEPLAGGAVIEWSGEGSAKGHSGKFKGDLQKVRSLGASAALLHPINADLEGTYAAGGINFSKFALSDDESSFTANVAIGNKVLSLQGIRLMNKHAVWLEGDALLPLDVWNAWPNTSFDTLLDDHLVCRVNLTAHDLQLREASQLTGWKFPIEGVVNGTLSAEGPIDGLKTGGTVSIQKGLIPLGGGASLTNVEGEFKLDGHTLKAAKFTGLHPTGDFSAQGEVDFAKLRNPVFQLDVTSAKSTITLSAPPPAGKSIFIPVSATAALHLSISGPLSAGNVQGDAKVSVLNMAGTLDLAHYLTPVPSEGLASEEGEWPPPFMLTTKPWSAWSLDVHCKAASNAQAASSWHPAQAEGPSPASTSELQSWLTAMDLRLAGPASAPALTGNFRIQEFPVHSGLEDLVVADGSWEFEEGAPRSPVMNLRVEGRAFGEPFTADITSVGSHWLRNFGMEMDMSEQAIQKALSPGYRHGLLEEEDILHVEVPRIWSESIEPFPWTPIADPAPASAPTPAAGTTPPPAAASTPPAGGAQ